MLCTSSLDGRKRLELVLRRVFAGIGPAPRAWRRLVARAAMRGVATCRHDHD